MAPLRKSKNLERRLLFPKAPLALAPPLLHYFASVDRHPNPVSRLYRRQSTGQLRGTLLRIDLERCRVERQGFILALTEEVHHASRLAKRTVLPTLNAANEHARIKPACLASML